MGTTAAPSAEMTRCSDLPQPPPKGCATQLRHPAAAVAFRLQSRCLGCATQLPDPAARLSCATQLRDSAAAVTASLSGVTESR